MNSGAPAPLRVWAPRASRVDLVTARGRSPMEREGEWFVAAPGPAPGEDYGFSLEGGDTLPDPRSPWQPHGVHGLSRRYDPAAFAWSDGAWTGRSLPDAVIYELHIGTFTPEGTLDAAAARLPDLAELGLTAVELMPVAEFPGERGWGYDGVDLYAVHHAYGGPAALDRFVDRAHACGLAVVMDVVYNHLGPDGNHLGAFGPYFTDRHRTPWGAAVNVDGPGSDEVRAFLVDNALRWLRDHHCDGLRLDAVHVIVDTSAVHLLEEIAVRVEALQAELGRTLWVIAESDLNDPRLLWRRDRGGYGLDAQWSDDFHHALHAALTGERQGYYGDFGPLADVATALRRAFVYDGRHSAYRGRRHGRPAGGVPGHRFLGYLQNHDQVGNRALGERSAALLPQGLLRVAAALVLTAPFVPLLFAGEEWGAGTPFLYFTDHRDPVLAAAVSQGRRQEFARFGWPEDSVPDPQDRATFERSVLDWSERDREPHASLLRWHRELIALRRTRPELRDGRMDAVGVEWDEEQRWLLLHRGALTVACNLGGGAVGVPGGAAPRRGLLASTAMPRLDGIEVELPPQSAVIWETVGTRETS